MIVLLLKCTKDGVALNIFLGGWGGGGGAAYTRTVFGMLGIPADSVRYEEQSIEIYHLFYVCQHSVVGCLVGWWQGRENH